MNNLYDLSRQQRLLATVINAPHRLPELVESGLTSDAFYGGWYRTLWAELLDRTAKGLPISEFELLADYVARGESTGLLVEMLRHADPSEHILPHHTRELLDLQRRRSACELLERLVLRVRDGGPTELIDGEPQLAALDRVREALGGHRPTDIDRWSISAACSAFFTHTTRRAVSSIEVGPWPGLEPGGLTHGEAEIVVPWDVLAPGPRPAWRVFAGIAGPLAVDRLAVLVGPTGRGKSSFALQVAEAAAFQSPERGGGTPVLYMSCEMGVEELVARLLALRARGAEEGPLAWSSLLYRRLAPDSITPGLAQLEQDCPGLYLWSPSPEHRTVTDLGSMLRAIVKKHKRPPLVIVDYVQRLAEGEDIRLAVRSLSGELRALCRTGESSPYGASWPGAAALVLSSSGRGHYVHLASSTALEAACEKPEVRETLIGSGKESGELEFDAGLLLALTTDPGVEGRADPRRGLVAILKNRAGGVGHVPLVYLPACGRFEEAYDAG